MKDLPLLNVTPRILFLSHLMRCDGDARFMATFHVLIGWTWAHSTTRHLVFLHLSFWETFKGFSLSSFLSISTLNLHLFALNFHFYISFSFYA